MTNIEQNFSPENIPPQEKERAEDKEFFTRVYEHVDREKISYPEYEYTLGDERVSVIFKNQEHLFDPTLLAGKTVVLAGELPYARNTKTVEENITDLRASSKSLHLLNHRSRYAQKYHFKETIGDQTFGEKTPFNAYQIKPGTGLLSHQIESLREAATEGNALLLADTDVRTVIDVARVIENTFPEARLNASTLDTSDLGQLEDMMAASAFDQEGKLAPQTAVSRRLLLESYLGNETAQKKLKETLQKQQDRMPPYLLHQALVCKHHLEDELKGTDQTAFWYEGLKGKIEKISQFIEQYRDGQKIEIPEEVITELDKHMAIHMTSYYPVFDGENNEWVIPTHSKATGDRVGRLTVHFAIDGIATAAMIGEGNWEEQRFAVLTPLGQLMKKNGPMATFLPADTWWVVDPNKPGIRLPENATIIAQGRVDKKFMDSGPEQQKELDKTRSEQYHRDAKRPSSINHRGPDRFIQKWTTSLDQLYTIKQLLRDQYGIRMKGIGNEGWNMESGLEKQEEKSLRRELENIFPALGDSLHSYALAATFEKKVVSHLNTALLVDHQAELKDVDRSGLGDIGREKVDTILQDSPEQVVEQSRQALINFMNEFALSGKDKGREDSHIVIPKEFARQLVKLGIL